MSPPEFTGGTPAQWDSFHAATEAADARRNLRSAADRAVLDSVVAQTRLLAGMSVAELGCGDPRFLPRLAQACAVRVAGVDFSPIAIDRAHTTLTALGIDSSAIERGQIDEYADQHENEFDAVISFGLIEHFVNLEQILAAHFRCARPGGRVFVSAPNLSGLNLVWAHLVCPEIFSLDRQAGTVWHRAITMSEVAHVFRELGATEIDAQYIGGPRLWAYPERTVRRRSQALTFAARLARKGVNGTGEALNRASPLVARRISGRHLSPLIAIAGTKALE